MIRILHVIGSLNNGGSQAMIMSLYRNIDRSKMQFDFIVDRKDELFFVEEIQQMGGRIYVSPKFCLKNIYKFIKYWNVFFNEHSEYKVIHGHVRSTASIYLKIAKKYGLITIAHSHNTSSGKGLSALVKNILQYNIRYLADYLFACSKEAGKWLYGKKALNRKEFRVVKNAIDSNKYIYNQETRNRIRKKYNIVDNFVVGHVGRFHPQKNHDYLIEVFYEVYKKNPNALLMLVGSGELRKHIEEKVEKLGIKESVIFTGASSEVPDLMQAMDVFVFPSLFEGLGIVLIEAQATGLNCIVATSIPQEAYITSLIESISLKEGAKKWAEMVLRFSHNTRSKEVTNEIILKGYDIKKTAKEIQDFYIRIGSAT